MYLKSILAAGAVVALAGCASMHNTPPNAPPREEQALATKAANVLQEQMTLPENKRIPRALLAKARCIGVFPSFTKAAFVVGGARGHGIIACQSQNGQSWNSASPAFYTLSSGSVGFQAGVQSSSIILLFLSPQASNALTSNDIKFGADVGIAAGPVGWNASVNNAPAAVVSYQVSSNGLFAGISLSGSTLRYDQTSTSDVYHQQIADPQAVLFQMNTVPSSVNVFNDALARYTAPASNSGSMIGR